MDSALDLHDIQGNIIKGYGRYGYPKARYIFYTINDEKKARQFLQKLIERITTSAPWSIQADKNNTANIKPTATTNIAFTYQGLKAIGVPRESLQTFPAAFCMGMKERRDILGDDGISAPENWDPIWQADTAIHIWLSINGQSEASIDECYQAIGKLVSQSESGIEQLSGHRGDNGADNLPFQQASAVYQHGKPTPKEHFGYTDGISDPYFKGSGSDPANIIGGGKLTGKNPKTAAGWQPLETGEFILGHRDEAYEYPKSPQPRLLSHNGTFMVYRKLHENVGSFNHYLTEMAKDFPGGEEALAAKFSGRWRNGAPITTFPSKEEADSYIAELQNAASKAKASACPMAKAHYQRLKQQLVAFNFDDDLSGGKCPVGAHIRRVNPRGSLEFGVKDAYATPGALVNRRRIIRRGLPYGEVKDATKDDGDHGIIFMAINADIERQFEFVQQQWIIYGNDFKLSNDKDPLLGNHEIDEQGNPEGRMVIEGDKEKKQAPFFCSQIPRLVEVRGGDYFFIPSLTAL
jgi:Dyp-type peroxidase family